MSQSDKKPVEEFTSTISKNLPENQPKSKTPKQWFIEPKHNGSDKKEISDSSESENVIDSVELKSLTFDTLTFKYVKILKKNISQIQFYWKDSNQNLLKTYQHLLNHVENDLHKQVLFATNAGIFSTDLSPLGLYIENGLKHVDLNHASGTGNFYLQPNGVFYINKSFEAKVVTTTIVQNTSFSMSEVLYATQSGPMLVINKVIPSIFGSYSSNKFIRNGVGVNDQGDVYFVLSKEKVNFYALARMFKESLKCSNALYLDGNTIPAFYVSSENLHEVSYPDLAAFIAVTLSNE